MVSLLTGDHFQEHAGSGGGKILRLRQRLLLVVGGVSDREISLAPPLPSCLPHNNLKTLLLISRNIWDWAEERRFQLPRLFWEWRAWSTSLQPAVNWCEIIYKDNKGAVETRQMKSSILVSHILVSWRFSMFSNWASYSTRRKNSRLLCMYHHKQKKWTT